MAENAALARQRRFYARSLSMTKAAPPPPSATETSDRLLQLLGGAEGDLLAGLDLDGFASGRVPSHARCTLPHLQNAQAADADPVALLQVLPDQSDQVVQDRLGLLLRNGVGFGKLRRQVLQRHCRGGRRLRWLIGWHCF